MKTSSNSFKDIFASFSRLILSKPSKDSSKLFGDIVGNKKKNVLKGGSENNRIEGGGGNDILQGNGGSDVLWGGSGDDSISGGSGRNIIYGEGGNDYIFTGQGNDRVDGGRGRDTAVIYGKRSNFSVTTSGQKTILTKAVKNGDDIRVSLRNVETVKFSNNGNVQTFSIAALRK